MPKNPGKQPEETKGKRVKVRFYSGQVSTQHNPPHWPADTLDWTLSIPPKPYEIKQYEIE